MERRSAAHADLLAALDRIEATVRENATRIEEIQARAGRLRAALAEGTPLAELLATTTGPLSVELVSRNLEALQEAGSHFRYALARALREEGLTIQAIADLFGVTRQRISALLRQHQA